jgi:hypothetical protein
VLDAKNKDEAVSRSLSELRAAEQRMSSSLAGYLDRHNKAKETLNSFNEQFTQVQRTIYTRRFRYTLQATFITNFF